MRYQLAPGDLGPPEPFPANSYIANDLRFRASADRPVLGFLGMPALEQFEVIVDYGRKQLTLIRVDTAGVRQEQVPYYTIAKQIPLVPSDRYWWGIDVILGDTVSRVLKLDTGAPMNMLSDRTRAHLGEYVRESAPVSTPRIGPGGTSYLDKESSWMVTRATITGFDGSVQPLRIVQGPERMEILGAEFLKSFRVVGFNFRNYRMLVYKGQ